MICPLKFNSNTLDKDGTCAYYQNQCDQEYCRAWEPKSKYNTNTKRYDGDCRLFMLDRKLSGGINAHSY